MSRGQQALPMPGSSLEEWLLTAIATACRCERTAVTPASGLAELALDSLTLVSIVTQIELMHDVEVTVEDVAEMLRAARVADVLAVLERRIESGGSRIAP